MDPSQNLHAKSQQLVLVLNPKCHNTMGRFSTRPGVGCSSPGSREVMVGCEHRGDSILAPHTHRVTEPAVPHPIPPVGTRVLLSQPPMTRGLWPSMTG